MGPSLRREGPRVSKTYPGHRPFRRNRMKPGSTTAESKLTPMKSTALPGRSRCPTRCTHADEPAANMKSQRSWGPGPSTAPGPWPAKGIWMHGGSHCFFL